MCVLSLNQVNLYISKLFEHQGTDHFCVYLTGYNLKQVILYISKLIEHLGTDHLCVHLTGYDLSQVNQYITLSCLNTRELIICVCTLQAMT